MADTDNINIVLVVIHNDGDNCYNIVNDVVVQLVGQPAA